MRSTNHTKLYDQQIIQNNHVPDYNYDELHKIQMTFKYYYNTYHLADSKNIKIYNEYPINQPNKVHADTT